MCSRLSFTAPGNNRNLGLRNRLGICCQMQNWSGVSIESRSYPSGRHPGFCGVLDTVSFILANYPALGLLSRAKTRSYVFQLVRQNVLNTPDSIDYFDCAVFWFWYHFPIWNISPDRQFEHGLVPRQALKSNPERRSDRPLADPFG